MGHDELRLHVLSKRPSK